jgi:hypothetical protein
MDFLFIITATDGILGENWEEPSTVDVTNNDKYAVHVTVVVPPPIHQEEFNPGAANCAGSLVPHLWTGDVDVSKIPAHEIGSLEIVSAALV